MHWSQFCGELCCPWQSEDVSLEIAGFLSGLGFDTTVAIRSRPLRLFDQVRHDNGIYDLRRNLIEWLSVKDKKANRLLEIFYERGCISSLICHVPFTSTWPRLRCDVGLEEGNMKKSVSVLQYCVLLYWCRKVRAVLTGRSTVSGFDLAWFSSLSSEHLCDFGFLGAI